MSECTEMVECMIAHLMSFLNDLIVKVVVAQHILTDHKKGSLHAILPQRLENERRRFWDWSIVEGKIDSMLMLVHSPQRLGIYPSQPFCRLLNNHRLYC